MEFGQFHKPRIISKNAHVNVIYLSHVRVAYISFGVGYCLLLGLGSPEPRDSNTQWFPRLFCINACGGDSKHKLKYNENMEMVGYDFHGYNIGNKFYGL